MKKKKKLTVLRFKEQEKSKVLRLKRKSFPAQSFKLKTRATKKKTQKKTKTKTKKKQTKQNKTLEKSNLCSVGSSSVSVAGGDGAGEERRTAGWRER